MIPVHLERCVCSHPRGIHLSDGICVRCQCGRFLASAAQYTKEEWHAWDQWLRPEAA